MIKKILKGLLLLLALVTAVVLINTFRFSKEIPHKQALPLTAINDSAVQHLSEAVQIKTVSYADSLPVDTASFLQFRKFLETAYPLVHQKLPRQIFNQFSYLFKWEGKNAALAPYVIMAHMDVVPVEAAALDKWTVAPFGGVIKDSTVWGRGTADDKGCVISILEAVEELLRQNYQPERTIYLSFGHDEEISGTRGASAIADWFRKQNIHPELVIDEGGEITVENFPELKRPIAVIGVGEKGYLSFQLTVEKTGGHSSMPDKETAMDILAKALVNLRSEQMPFRMSGPVEVLLNRVGPGMPFGERMALANQWLFKPILKKEFEKSHVTNALFHTTIVPTVFNSGVKDNVIPGKATVIVNSRNLPDDPQGDVIAFMKKQIHDDRVQIIPEKVNKDASKISSIDGAAFKKIEDICYQVMPDVVPVPYLLMGGTDSRHFDDIAKGVIRFAASIDAKGYHGIDERLPINDFKRMIFFYSLLIKESGTENNAKPIEVKKS
ncbi:MAG: M20/M25/M40 family metallo-hydrolase [Bacteroidetes bacterium]|nr:M20/M25/M40 family metallo-hydrolase [Bacteroidota bacterium]